MVSIIIPVFNRKQLVQKMIYSIIFQTYSQWELLLIDDGSTDGTYEMMKKHEEMDIRIKLIKRDRLPKGAPTCRNIGLDNAQGEYVIFFDSDDLISNKCIEERVKTISSDEKIDFSIFPAVFFEESKEKDNKICLKNSITGTKLDNDALSSLLRGEYPFLVCTNIYRRYRLIEQNIRWDENLLAFQDFDFNIQVLSESLSSSYSDSLLPDYYIRLFHNENSITSDLRDSSKYNSTLYLLEKIHVGILSNTKKMRYIADFRCFLLFYMNKIMKNNEIVTQYLSFCKKKVSRFSFWKMKNQIMMYQLHHNEKVWFILQYLMFFKLFIRKIEILKIKKSHLLEVKRKQTQILTEINKLNS